MELRNKEDGEIYHVETQDDDGRFRVFAVRFPDNYSFVMHYRSIEEFLNDWEDLD